MKNILKENSIVLRQFQLKETLCPWNREGTPSGSPYFMERFIIIDQKFNNLIYNKIKIFVDKLLNTLDISYGPCHVVKNR